MTERSKSRAMAIPGGGNRQRLDHSESFPMQEQSVRIYIAHDTIKFCIL